MLSLTLGLVATRVQVYDGVEQITAGNVDFGTTLLTSKPSFLRQDDSDLQYLYNAPP